ncbi:MAG: Hsp20/alpha crystallin family protein [Lentisphaerae bacterium]|nr:Hsp20/alpha crystallin family protein [Lentisphaerota bacterium]
MSMKDLVPKLGKKSERALDRNRREDSLFSLQREMNRLFDNFFNGFDLAPWENSSLDMIQFSPKVDVSETTEQIKVSAELPGMNEKDVTVEMDDNTLTIRGEKKEENEGKNGNWHCKEQSYGSFRRIIPLPAAVDGEKAKASFKHGKLVITVPKKDEDKTNRKTIRIETA